MKDLSMPYNFKPRWYQLPVMQAYYDGIKNMDLVMPRRHGKDKVCVAIMADAMVSRVGGYYYIFPEFSQGRKALWDSIDNDGFKTLDHINPNLIAKKNDQMMRLELHNGSFLQVVGSNNVDALMGSNPVGMVFSEWSLQDPRVRGYLKPIQKANGGWAIYNYTPRGNNHARKFHDDAMDDPSWFSYIIDAKSAGVFSEDELEGIREEYIRDYGDDGLFMQEFMVSFDTPVQGAYYASQILMAENEARIGLFPPNREALVYTAWDLGARDSTAIWFFQRVSGGWINIVDYYEATGAGMDHYRDILEEKGYRYAKHYLPHDANSVVQSKSGPSVSKKVMLEQLGVRGIKVLTKGRVQDGIQLVRKHFPFMRFDRENCERGLAALKDYKKTWNERLGVYSDIPLHDWASDGADALRMLATAVESDRVKEPMKGKVVKSVYKPNGGYI